MATGRRDERDGLEFMSPEQYRERSGRDPVMPAPRETQGSDVLRLTWDAEVDAGYLPLSEIGPGDAVTEEIVASPVTGIGPIVLDFDARGRLLGIEFLDERSLPPGMSPS